MKTKKVIVLLGFPNTGKTSLFNLFTALHQKTVNYPGSTVDISIGPLVGHPEVLIVDTPGLLSLTPRTEDEAVAVNVLFSLDKMVPNLDPNYEIVLCAVIDTTQSVRHLAFIKPFLDARYRLFLAFNKNDIAEKIGETFNTDSLKTMLSCPFDFISVKEKKGLDHLKKTLIDLFDTDSPSVRLNTAPTNVSITSHYEWAMTVVEKARISNPRKEAVDLDSLFLHPWLGPFVFLAVMILFFYSIFSMAAPLMDMIDISFSALSGLIQTVLPSSFITTFLTDGVIAGLGGVFVFIPQLFILFFFIGAMESSGFLSRAVVLIDRPLSKIGLNGRSFVPLLSGCACAIPALMAARSIPGKKERFLSMFIIPLMQCSARLPVYGILISILFFSSPVKGGLFLTGIYIISVVLSLCVAAAGSKLMGKEKSVGFQMELPRWQWPELRPLLIQSVMQTKSFILRAGPIIVLTTLFLWFFSIYPSEEQSLLIICGKWIEPLFRPMGVDWRVGVALLMSFVAREVFVSALVVIFVISSEETNSIVNALRSATFEGSSDPIFTTASILSLVVFFMISLQCLSTFAVAKQEMKSWKLATFQLVFYVVFGYVAAVTVYQLVSLF